MDLFLHDQVYQWGGAEATFSHLASLNTRGSVCAVLGHEQLLRQRLPDRNARVLWHPASGRSARALVPLLAAALPRRRPLRGRVVCSSFAVARWLPVAEPRLVYCHSPMRQIWHGREMYASGWSPEALAIRTLSPWLRTVDRAATHPDDRVVVPSTRVAALVREAHGVAAVDVVPPPVSDELFQHPEQRKHDYFVWAGRVVEPIKRLGLLMEVFRRLPTERLVVVGSGRSLAGLRRTAPSNVTFAGWATGRSFANLIAEAKALLLPSMEDFGLIAAEALALGTPVILTPQAGVAEWIRPAENGVITQPTVDAFVEAVQGMARDDAWPVSSVRSSAAPFRASSFRDALQSVASDLQWL